MIFPRHKANNYELKCRIASELATPMLMKLIEGSIKNIVSDKDFTDAKKAILESSVSFAEQILKKASEK